MTAPTRARRPDAHKGRSNDDVDAAALRALGQLALAPIVAAAGLAWWLAARPHVIAALAGVAAVALALGDGLPDVADVAQHLAAAAALAALAPVWAAAHRPLRGARAAAQRRARSRRPGDRDVVSCGA